MVLVVLISPISLTPCSLSIYLLWHICSNFSSGVVKMGRINFLPNGGADLRTNRVKRVRIANRLSGMHVSAKSETLRAWSKSKTGIKGEGLKVGIAQLVRYDMCRHRF